MKIHAYHTVSWLSADFDTDKGFSRLRTCKTLAGASLAASVGAAKPVSSIAFSFTACSFSISFFLSSAKASSVSSQVMSLTFSPRAIITSLSSFASSCSVPSEAGLKRFSIDTQDRSSHEVADKLWGLMAGNAEAS